MLALFAAVVAVIFALPSDRDQGATTTPEFLAAYADPPGRGTLDGIRCDTRMGPRVNVSEIEDFVQFDRGLFTPRECTDRCNYPPSAYLTRETDEGTAFIVEAFCPTKDITMVWRGLVRDGRVSGTVTWTSDRLLWTTQTVLDFAGKRSALAAKPDNP